MLQFKKDLLGSSSVDYYGKPKRWKSRKSKKYGSQHKKYLSQKTKGFGGIGGKEWNRRNKGGKGFSEKLPPPTLGHQKLERSIFWYFRLY